jgi:hypothetical protein
VVLESKQEPKNTKFNLIERDKINTYIKAIIRQKSPMASERAKPRMAYEKSCCFKLGLRA